MRRRSGAPLRLRATLAIPPTLAHLKVLLVALLVPTIRHLHSLTRRLLVASHLFLLIFIKQILGGAGSRLLQGRGRELLLKLAWSAGFNFYFWLKFYVFLRNSFGLGRIGHFNLLVEDHHLSFARVVEL